MKAKKAKEMELHNPFSETDNDEHWKSSPASGHPAGDPPPTPTDAFMKVVTWNVAGMASVIKKGFEEYVKAEQPDVLCLQEIKMVAEKMPQLPHYQLFCSPSTAKKGYAGTAVYVKNDVPATQVQEYSDEEGRIICVELPNFYLINTYVPNSGRGLVRLDYRLKTWDKQMEDILCSLKPKKAIIWCGDLNVARFWIDLRNPKSNKRTAGFTIEERTSFEAILTKNKLIDVFRHFFPDLKDFYTFWGYMGNNREKNVGWRLDYFIVNEEFLPSINSIFRRGSVLGSDHVPIGLLLNK